MVHIHCPVVLYSRFIIDPQGGHGVDRVLLTRVYSLVRFPDIWETTLII